MLLLGFYLPVRVRRQVGLGVGIGIECPCIATPLVRHQIPSHKMHRSHKILLSCLCHMWLIPSSPDRADHETTPIETNPRYVFSIRAKWLHKIIIFPVQLKKSELLENRYFRRMAA